MRYAHIVITVLGPDRQDDACHLEVDECPEHNFRLGGYTLGPFQTQEEAEAWGRVAVRCQKRTGVSLDKLFVEELSDGDTLPGGFLCWGSVPGAALFVCPRGYPDRQDEDGFEYWDPVPENFVLVKAT